MSRGLNVFVNIGAKVGSSVRTATRETANNFERMGRRLKVIGAETKATLAGIEEAQNQRWAVIAKGAAAAYVGSRAIQPFVTFEDRLVRLGNTAEVHGARLNTVGQEIIRTGAQFGTGASLAAEGVNDFVAAGLALDTSVKALAPTLKLAKTSGIEITEASQAGISVIQNLGVEVGNVSRAFDIMAKAGKLGRFELNDMAKAFPGLASRAKLLGMSGTDGVARLAAMLQPIREGARDADEAANNLLNFFDKLTGKETTDNFAKLGVSIPDVFAKAKREGRDFVSTMLDEIGRLTKGGTDAFALSQLFPDRQARQAALLLLQNRDKTEAIRRQSLNSNGTLDADFERISKTSKFGLDRAVAGLERIGIALGKAFGPSLGEMAERFAGMAERFATWAEKHPTIIKTIGSLVIGMIALRTAVAGVGLVFGGVTGRLARFGAGKLAKGISLLIGRLIPLRWAMVAARYGIWGLAKDLGGKLSMAFARFGPKLLGGLRALGPLMLRGLAMLAPIVMKGLAMAFALLSNPVGWAVILAGVAAAAIYYFRDDIAKAWPKVVEWFKNAWTGLKDWVLSINWKSVGLSIANALTGGLASKFGSALSSLASSIPGLGGGGPKLAGARANGGPVRKGGAYLVGEEGPEVVTFGHDGVVHPNRRPPVSLIPTASEALGRMVLRWQPRQQHHDKPRERRNDGLRALFDANFARGDDTGRSGSGLAMLAAAGAAMAPLPAAAAAAKPPLNVTVNVSGAQDPLAVAREVRREIERLVNGQAALLSD